MNMDTYKSKIKYTRYEGRMSKSHQKVVGLMHYGPEIVITQHASDSLAPLVELEGEAYLEKLEGRMSKSHQKVVGLMHYGPEIVITQHASDSLAPLVELEGEAYLEKLGGVRRHTIANAHSNLQLLAVASMMHSGMVEEDKPTLSASPTSLRPRGDWS
ncbi:UNVERIFIED_CONTAM: hypothetical protein FKN15_025888 [Acipenser sinensis]